MDDLNDHAAVAILRNDQIDFLDFEDRQVEYEDDFRDDDDDDDEEGPGISHYPNGEEERAIGLDKQNAKR